MVSVGEQGTVTVKVSEFEVAALEVTVTGKGPALAMAEPGIVATIWPAVTERGVIAEPLKFTVAGLVKPAPLTVRLKAAPPATAVLGLKEVIDKPLLFEFRGLAVWTTKSVEF
jgi:hypothetical protein